MDLVPASCNISSLRDVELTEDDRMELSALLSGPADDEVLIDKYNIDMTRKKLSCLKPQTWLNDEVINFYVAMMMQEGGSIYSFSTFFMIRLFERGNYTFKNVARWTKKLDIFRHKKMFIPINYENEHWVLVVIDLTGTLQVLLSMILSSKCCSNVTLTLQSFLKWLKEEAKAKRKLFD